MKIDTLYNENLQKLPVTAASLAQLNFGYFRCILHYHNVSAMGTKDELVLKVALLRSG